MLFFPYRTESSNPFSTSTPKTTFQFHALRSTENSYSPTSSSTTSKGRNPGDVAPTLQNTACPSVVSPFTSGHRSIFPCCLRTLPFFERYFSNLKILFLLLILCFCTKCLASYSWPYCACRLTYPCGRCTEMSMLDAKIYSLRLALLCCRCTPLRMPYFLTVI